MPTQDRIQRITTHLSTLNPHYIDLQDDGHLHIGHEGSKHGGHFTLTIVGDVFENLPVIKRHRLVYQAVASLMQTDIHALSIHAFTLTEFQKESSQ